MSRAQRGRGTNRLYQELNECSIVDEDLLHKWFLNDVYVLVCALRVEVRKTPPVKPNNLRL